MLDRTQALRKAGLDDGSLAALTRVFGQVAKGDGITPAQAVARFLKAATDFEGITTFEHQAAEAEVRAKKAEADAQQRERSAKVRKVGVDWAEWFVRRGITVEAVGAWRAAGEKLGLTVEDLAHGLADALQQFGTLEAACQAKAKERDGLAAEADKLKAGNAALRKDQTRIRAALEAVTADGEGRIARVQKAATAAIEVERGRTQAAMANLDGRMAATLERLAALEHEAGELQKFVGWARALASRDPGEWREVEPETWAALLWHLGRWVEAAGVNPRVPISDEVKRASRGSTDYPTLHGPFEVPILGLAAWLAEGLQAVPAAATLALAAGRGQVQANGRT